MKELVLFFGALVGAVAAIFGLIEIMSSGISGGTAILIGIMAVVVIPVVAGIVIAKREKRNEVGTD